MAGNARITITTFESLTSNSAGGIGKLSYGLAAHLHNKGFEVRFLTINKGPHQTTFPSESVHWSSRGFLYLINKLAAWKLLDLVKKRRLEEQYYDFFLSRKKLKGDYLITTHAFMPRTLKKAKGFKHIAYIPPTPNELEIEKVCRNELAHKGVQKVHYNDAYTDRRRLKKFEASLPWLDQVISISPVTTNSFSHLGKCVMEVPFIHIPKRSATDLLPQPPKQQGKVVFLYIAYSVLLKGLHRLLDEWKLVAPENAELHIAGPVSAPYKATFDLSGLEAENVRFLGYTANPTPFYQQADVIIIPSLIDNEPTTATEALSLGKPVLLSSTCGYARFVGEMVPDAVFDVFKPGMLAQKINAAATDMPAFKAKYADLIEYTKHKKFDQEEFFATIAGCVLNYAPNRVHQDAPVFKKGLAAEMLPGTPTLLPA